MSEPQKKVNRRQEALAAAQLILSVLDGLPWGLAVAALRIAHDEVGKHALLSCDVPLDSLVERYAGDDKYFDLEVVPRVKP